MKILFVSISAPPKNSPESIQTGKFLSHLSLKFDITLITTKPSKGWAPFDESMCKYLHGVERVVELVSVPYKIIMLLKWIFPTLVSPDPYFYFHRYNLFLRKITKPDLILSRSTPYSSAVMGLKLKKRFKVPWVMHMSDPWVDNPFYHSHGKLKEQDKEWELKCFTEADLITFTSRKTVNFYSKKYPHISNKFEWLPNVYDENDIIEPEICFDKTLKFVFTGRLYQTRNPKILIDAFRYLNKKHPGWHHNVEFIFAGFADPESIELLRGISCIKYLGHIGHNEAIKLQRNAHLLLIIDSLVSDSRYDLFLPSKLLDYMTSRKKILALTNENSSTRELVEKVKGVSFGRDSTELLANYILTCVDKFKSKDESFFLAPELPKQYSLNENGKKIESWIFKLARQN